MENKNIISLILKLIGADEVQDGIKGTRTACEQLSTTVRSLTGKFLAYAGSIQTLRKAWEYADMASQYQEQITALNFLAARYHTTAHEITARVKEAANGLISIADAANVSAKGLMIGLNPEQLTKFMQIVEATTNVTGQSVAQSFETITEAAAQGNERMIKSMGIVVDLQDKYLRYADTINVTANELTEEERQQVAVNAILEQGSTIMAQLGSSTDSVNDKMERFTVRVQELKLTLGDLIIRVGGGLLGVFHAIDFGLIEIADTVVGVFAVIEKGLNMIGIKSHAIQDLSGVLRHTKDELYQGMKESFSIMVSDFEKTGQARQNAFRNMDTGLTTHTERNKDAHRKWMEWEWAYADTVDRAGQEILDSYEERDRAVREHSQILHAAREAEINLQLKEIDLAEQEFRISKAGAVQERIRLNEELLRIQAEYLAQLDKIKDPASWYAQKNAIDQTKESLVQLNFALKEQTGTFGEGLLQGIHEFTNELNTTFQHGADFARQSAQAMESAFSDVFFDAMRGELQSFGDYWRSFSQTIMRMISEMVVKMLMMKALMAMGFGAMGGGGGVAMGTMGTTSPASGYFHKGGYIPRFHIGGLLSDEVPAILQKGEYVVSRKGVEGVGVDTLNRINKGDGVPLAAPERAPTIINHFTIQAIDAASFAVFAQKNKGIFANAVMSSAHNNHPIRRGR